VRRVLAAIAAALLLAAPCAAAQASYGILLLAHGGDETWNQTIADIAKALDAQAPTETALGMAQVPAMQLAVDKLQTRGVAKIVAVPLFVHSRSEVLDQTRYALGLRDKPSEVLRDALAAMARAHAHMRHGAGGMPMGHMMEFSTATVRLRVPIVMTPALDDSKAVAEVLARRAKSLSKTPSSETVVLVGHGPVDEADNAAWLSTMRLQAARVKKTGPYRGAVALTIRDDNRPEVKNPALAELRKAVEQANRNGGRALVVPYLISRGGIESHVVDALEGLDYAWDGKTLCPDPAINAWAAETAAKHSR
jgi:sirohydrochlorin ferrochelatase